MNAMQPPQSIEEIKAGLETTEKGGVRQSIRNCLTVFQRDPLLSGAIAYNILTDRKDIIKPIGFHRESTALNDTDMKYLLLYLEETYGLTNEKKIDNAIGIVANENKYHPIRDYPNMSDWEMLPEERQQLDQETTALSKELNEMLNAKNRIAEIEQEFLQLNPEQHYFEEYYATYSDAPTESLDKLSSQKILALWMEFEQHAERESRLGLLQKLSIMF